MHWRPGWETCHNSNTSALSEHYTGLRNIVLLQMLPYCVAANAAFAWKKTDDTEHRDEAVLTMELYLTVGCHEVEDFKKTI